MKKRKVIRLTILYLIILIIVIELRTETIEVSLIRTRYLSILFNIT